VVSKHFGHVTFYAADVEMWFNTLVGKKFYARKKVLPFVLNSPQANVTTLSSAYVHVGLHDYDPPVCRLSVVFNVVDHTQRFELSGNIFSLVKEAFIEIGCVVTSLVVGWLVGCHVHPRPIVTVTMEH